MQNRYKTLIILDWDDTLFPTSWISNKINNFNLTTIQTSYISLFSKLDVLLEDLLAKLLKCGKVVIVTNATLKWITMTLQILPNTKKVIRNNIDVISAKDMYHKKYADMMLWKKLIFRDLVIKYFKENKYAENIISVGDASYEFNALVELYNKKKKRILKTIRLLQSPTYDLLIDQLEVLTKSVHKICDTKKHMDLKFEIK